MEPHSHVYDESDTCFECGKKRPEGRTDALPGWLWDIVEMCPSEKIDLNQK